MKDSKMKYSEIHSNKQVAKQILQHFFDSEASDLFEELTFLDIIGGEEPEVVLLQDFQGAFFSIEQIMSEYWGYNREKTVALLRLKLHSSLKSLLVQPKEGLIKCTSTGRVWLPKALLTGEKKRVQSVPFKWASTPITTVAGEFGAGKRFIQTELAAAFDRCLAGEDIGKGTVIIFNPRLNIADTSKSNASLRPAVWKGQLVSGWQVLLSVAPVGSFNGMLEEEIERGSKVFIYRDAELLKDKPENWLPFLSLPIYQIFTSEVETTFASGATLTRFSVPIWRTQKERENPSKIDFLCKAPAVNEFWQSVFLTGIIRYEFGDYASLEKYNLVKGKMIYSRVEKPKSIQQDRPEKATKSRQSSLLLYKTKEKKEIKVAMTSKKKNNCSDLFPEIKTDVAPEKKKREKKSSPEVLEKGLETLEKEDAQLPEKSDLEKVSQKIEEKVLVTEEVLSPVFPVVVNLHRADTKAILAIIVDTMKSSGKWKKSKNSVYIHQEQGWQRVQAYQESELQLHIWLIDSFDWRSGEVHNMVAPMYLAPLVLHKALEVLPDMAKEEIPLSIPEASLSSQDLFQDMEKRKVKTLSTKDLTTGGIYYLDIETSGIGEDGPLNHRKNRIELISLSDGKKGVLYSARNQTEQALKDFFKVVFQNFIIGHNLLFDLSTIFAKTGLLPEKVFDTMLAEQLIVSGTKGRVPGPILKGSGLKDTLKRRLEIEVDKSEQVSNWAKEWTAEQLEYSYCDTVHLANLAIEQVRILNALNSDVAENPIGLKNKVARLEMAMVPVCVEMTVQGIPVNFDAIEKEIVTAHEKEIQRREAFLSLYPQVQNINSNTQVLTVLNSDGYKGANLQEDTLKEFTGHEGVDSLLAYKQAAQVHRNLKKYCFSVIYPNWLIIGSPPGRMSSSSPNVQNIPRYLKSLFYAPNLTLVRADYPAIELRIAAAYANEKPLIDAFNSGADPHKLTASRITGKAEENITKEERQLAKAMNYGLLYGMGAKRFKDNANSEYGLNLTLEEASEFRNKFFSAYPSLKSWHNVTEKSLRQGRGVQVSTLMGRRIWHPEEDYSNALNSPIQGTGADMLKYAAVGIYTALLKMVVPEGLDRPRILNLIHDEIVVTTPPALKNTVAIIVRDWMQKSAKLLLPEVETPIEVEFQEATEVNFDLK